MVPPPQMTSGPPGFFFGFAPNVSTTAWSVTQSESFDVPGTPEKGPKTMRTHALPVIAGRPRPEMTPVQERPAASFTGRGFENVRASPYASGGVFTLSLADG